MNKGTQIFLLIVLFAASVAGGYFLEEVVMGEGSSKSRKTVVAEPEEVKSTIPDSLTWTAPKKAKSGKYSFTASASVESGDSLCYYIYKDKDCLTMIEESTKGEFNDIPANKSGIYYLRVQNMNTREYSVVCDIEGFKEVQKCIPITKADLENAFNVEKTTPGWFKNSLAPGCDVRVLGMRADEFNPPKTLGAVCDKIEMEIWTSVVVNDVDYNDETGQLTKVVITVNY